MKRVFFVRLTLQGYLHFSSFEIDGVSITSPYLNNTALNHAFNFLNEQKETHSYANWRNKIFPIHCHPAKSAQYSLKEMTRNIIHDIYQNSNPISKKNTDSYRKFIYIEPLSVFETFVFANDLSIIPKIIRLGKRDTPVKVEAIDVKIFDIVTLEKKRITNHLVNPLDVSNIVSEGIIINIPPIPILKNPLVLKNTFLLTNFGEIQVPKQICL